MYLIFRTFSRCLFWTADGKLNTLTAAGLPIRRLSVRDEICLCWDDDIIWIEAQHD